MKKYSITRCVWHEIEVDAVNEDQAIEKAKKIPLSKWEITDDEWDAECVDEDEDDF